MLSDYFGPKVKFLLGGVLCLSFYVCANNAQPIVVDDIIKLQEDTQLNFDPTSNDINSNSNEPLKLLAIHTKPSHGTAYRQGKTAKYVPDNNFCGTDSFTYYVGDNKGNKSIGKVNVVVSCINDAPIANPDVMSLQKNNRALLNPLTNDKDSEGDRLYLHSIKSQPKNGKVSIINTYVQYTPNHEFCGNDNFSYNVSDGHANQSFAIVSINVQCFTKG